MQYARISALAEPSTHNVRELVTWIHDKELGNVNVAGHAVNKWGPYSGDPRGRRISLARFIRLPLSFVKSSTKDPVVSDLIAPRAGKPLDWLSRWISEEVLPFKWDFGEQWSKKHQRRSDEKRNNEEGKAEEGKAEEINEKQSEKATSRRCDDRIVSESPEIL